MTKKSYKQQTFIDQKSGKIQNMIKLDKKNARRQNSLEEQKPG